MHEVIHADDAPAKPADFSQAMAAGGKVYTAGQVPMTAHGEIRADDPLNDQTRLVLRNLRAVLREADCSLTDVLKTTVYLTDMDGFEEMNGVYREFFDADRGMPARSVVAVDDVLKGADIEISAVAVRDD